MKQLRIGVHYEPSGVDPHIGAAELALQMTNGVLDTLVNRTVEGDYLPGLAESFSVSDDQCVYTFNLRQDVTFHDGTPFNAEAVKFSLDRAHNPENNSQLAGGLLGTYKHSRVVSEYCVEAVLAKPYALFLDALSQGWLAPVSPKAVAEMGKDFARHPVGTGPYVFDRWDAGDCIVIKRNEAYAWGPPMVENKGAAKIDEIVFKFLLGGEARTNALLNGEVDAIYFTNPEDCAKLRKDERFTVETWPIRGVPVSLMMNTKKTPTKELAVRQAIAAALDVDALVDEVYFGEFARAYGPVSQFTLGYEPEVETVNTFDLERANKLLDEAGWVPDENGMRHRDGEALEVNFYALPVNNYPLFGEIVTRQLAKAGIGVEVILCDPVPWIRAGMRGDHNLIPQGKYASTSQFLSFVYHSSQSGPTGYGWSKRAPEDFAIIDELIEKAETLQDKKDYIPLLNQVQLEVVRNVLAVPLHCNANIVAATHAVKGIKYDAIGAYPLFHDADLSVEEAANG